MKTRPLLVWVLFVILGLSVSAQGLQASEGIKTHGMIEYSEHTPPVIIKCYTATWSFKDIDAEPIADLFDACQAWISAAEKIRQVRQIKQDFTALLYRNTKHIYNYREDEWQTALNNDWILKDENAQLVYITVYSGAYFVDIGNSEYQIWVANWISEQIEQCGFDGVFTDLSLNAVASEYFWKASTPPINPRTGNFWKDEEVRQALIGLHKRIKNAIGSKLLVCNGIFDGHRFWQKYNGYMEVLSNSPLDGIMSEGLWYHYQGVWMSEEEWLESLDFLVFIQENFLIERPERVFIPICKQQSIPGDPYPLPSGSTKEQMATYAFTSTLLGIANSQNYLGIFADLDFVMQVVQPLHDVDVGTPVDDYYIVEGTHVYARDFSNVKVLVNPTPNPYTIDLHETFRTLNGEIVTEITVEDHAGLILMKSQSS